MAVRPVASRGGLTGAHYGMITFAILTVASLGLFIFTFTRVQSAEQEAESARRKQQEYGNPPAWYAQEARNRRSTVFGVMDQEMQSLAGLVTGDAADVSAAIQAKSETLLKDVAERKPATVNASDTLLTAIERLDAAHTEQKDRADALDAVLSDTQAELESTLAQLHTAEQQFSTEVANLQKQLEQANQEKFDALAQKDQQLAAMQSETDALNQQLQSIKREGLQQVQEQQFQNQLLQRQLQTLQEEMRQFKQTLDPTSILTKADGRILRAIPGSDVVYINLGSDDGIKPGMPFEVFSQTGDLPEGLSGKASLEVVNVMPATSECRVTRRQAGAPIIEGDIVVNIAYERDRQPRFVIRGDFDLNYDGIPDPDGRDQVRTMIEQYGGKVVNDLDETVDFVVIGVPPVIPEFERGRPMTPTVRALVNQKMIELSGYKNLIEKAESMYIPVISQSPFLYLMGYPGEGIIRRH